jgi:hypothetical protein
VISRPQGLKNQFRKWVVEWATSSNDPDALGVDKFNIFVGGLNPHLATKAALEERFAVYGQVEGVTLINRDEDHDLSLGMSLLCAKARAANAYTARVCPQPPPETPTPSFGFATPRRPRPPSSRRCAHSLCLCIVA